MHFQTHPKFIALALSSLMVPLVHCQAQTPYHFGDPTAEEQLYIERINRARANPAAEGSRLAGTTDPDVLNAYSYFNVDLAMMQSEFNTLTAVPPLAPNASLTTAARSHSSWMLANAVQDHYQTNPDNDPFTRMTAAGFNYSTAGENIYASAKSVWHGHAGFQVDWGSGGTGGMQNPRGHRASIHNSSFREIGVGVAFGTNGGVGPQLVTQDFGTEESSHTFGTGVAYYDLNADNSYDSGEGISGLTVNVSGASYYCTTATGGGWVVPVPTTAATRTVTFSGLGVNQTASLVVPSATNAKADLKLAYAPPVITSSSSATAGDPHTLTFSAVGGATGHVWNRWTLATAAVENCESTANITSSTTGTYSVLNTAVKQQGAASFHLAIPTADVQAILLNTWFYGGTSPTLSFQSSVRATMSSDHCKVQVQEEGGTTWRDVYDQVGYDGSGESTFSLRNATLTDVAGKKFRVRFLLAYGGNGTYGTGDLAGWFIDAISFSGVFALINPETQILGGTSGSFTPSTGTYLMSVAPVISGRNFPAAYQTLTVTTGAVTPPSITTQPASVTVATGTTATFTFSASGGSLGYQWYAGNSGITTNPVSGANGSSFTTPVLASTASYWVRVTNTAGTADSQTATATVINPPAITTHPVSVTIHSGNTATFTVAASGTSPGFQWYAGNSGNTANPVSGATGSSFTTTALSSTTSYWVRVSNAVGAANSNTATATVIIPPVITSHPASVTLNSGATATFTVAASGTSPTYQWYLGNSGVITNPVSGATASSFTTPALSSTTSYWVRVSNAAGTAGSNTATATVAVPPTIVCQPVSTTVKKSTETITIAVIAAGPALSFQWYEGNSGVITKLIPDATGSTFTTPLLTKATSYWVRVSNAAGFVNSITSTVGVSNSTVSRSFTSWSAEIQAANSLAAGTISNPYADHDKDGRSNLIEYAFGCSPLLPNDPAPRMPVAQSTATHFVLQYRQDTALTDITLTAQASSSLGNWKAPADSGAPAGFTDTLVSTAGTIQTREARIPKTTSGNWFMRVKAGQQ